MRIQVNSDRTVEVTDDLKTELRAHLRKAFKRFDGSLTRAEIHLSDINGIRGGANDKQCLLEVRPAGLDPLISTDQANTIDAAFKGATRKMTRKLTTRFGRIGRPAPAPKTVPAG